MNDLVKILLDREDQRMASLPLSTDTLDLTTLPDRLDDETFARVQAIAESSLPPAEIVGDRHLNQCLRVMLAVLPKRNSDEISGELFVAAYQRKLATLPLEQINYISDKVLETCKWFPTIAECLEIGAEWRRNDDWVKRRYLAKSKFSDEDSARRKEARMWEYGNRETIPQEQVDALSPNAIRIGLEHGALMHDESGKIIIKPYERDADGLIW